MSKLAGASAFHPRRACTQLGGNGALSPGEALVSGPRLAEMDRLDQRFRALLSREDWAALPEAVRVRFSKRLGPGDTAVYVGRIIEMRATLVGRLLAQLVRLIGAPLPLVADIGTASVVSVTEDGASGGQVWTRLYAHRRGFPQIIHSAKRFAGPTGLEEYVGRGIGMALDVSVEADALVFSSRHFFVRIGGRPWRLPSWLGPGRVRVAHQDLGNGAFRFTLDVARPRIDLRIRQVGIYRDHMAMPCDASRNTC